MFQWYTERAKRVIFFARYEASQFGSPYIETEHILLGLMREDRALMRGMLPSKASIDAIRKEIEDWAARREKTATSVDLPLSNECKRVLAHAAEEAARLENKNIGTEHLLLGLLREQGALATRVLNSQGLLLDNVRESVSRWTRTGATRREVVEIHGKGWDPGYIQAQLAQLRKFAWQQRQWKPMDVMIEISSDRVFFDVAAAVDPAFKFVAAGWPREFCELCGWELNADGDTDHATGYTNGREWLCTECYTKFLKASDKSVQ